MAKVELVLALNTSAAEQAVARISKQAQDMFKSSSGTGIAKSAMEASASFTAAQKSAQDAVSRNQQLVASMLIAGQGNTAEFAKAKTELEKSAAAARQIDDALKQAKEIAGDVAPVSQFEKLAKLMKFNETREAVQATADAVNSFGSGFVQLDTAVAKIKTLGADSAKIAPDIKKAAIEMSSSIPFSAAQIADAMGNAMASGVQGGAKELSNFADVAAKLAVGGGAEIDSVVAGLGATLNAFGKSANDSAKFADTMFNVVNFGVTSIDELNQYLSQVTPTAAAAGVSFENVGAGLALMTQKGVPTAQATTKLNALLLEIQKPGKALSDTFKQAGISSEQLAETIKTKGLPAALDMVGTAFKKTGKTATQAFSSSEAGAAFNILQGQAGQFQKFADDVANTSGSAQFAYEQMAQTVEVKSKQFEVNVDTMKTKLLSINPAIGASVTFAAKAFGNIAPSLTPLVMAGGQLKSLFAGSFDFIKNSASKLPGLLSSVGGATSSAFTSSANFIKNTFSSIPSLASSAASSIGGLFTAPAATIGSAFNGIKIAAASAWASITAPVALIVAAVALIGGALYLFFTQTDEGAQIFANIKQYFIDLWNNIKAFGAGVYATIKQFYTNNKETFKQLGGVLIELGRFIFEWMITPMKLAWAGVQALGSAIGWVAGVVGGWIAKLFPAKQEVAGVANVSNNASDKISGMAKALLYVRGVIGGVTGAFVAIRTTITDFVAAAASLNLGKIKEVLLGAGNNVSKGFTDGWNKATAAATEGANAQAEAADDAAKNDVAANEEALAKKKEQNDKAAKEKAKLDAEALKKYLENKKQEVAANAETAQKNQEALAITREVATTSQEQLNLDKNRLEQNKLLLASLQSQLKAGKVGGIVITKDNKKEVTDAMDKLQEDIQKQEIDLKPKVAKVELDGIVEARRYLQEQITGIQADITARVVPLVPARKELINKLTEQIAQYEAQIKTVAELDPAKAAELRAKVKELTKQIASETKIVVTDEYVSGAANAAEAEYRKMVASAETAFAERVKLQGRSKDEELADFKELLQKRIDAEEAYVKKSYTVQQKSVVDLFTSFADKTKKLFADAIGVSDEEKKQTKQQESELKKREQDLQQSLDRRKISLQEWYDGMADLEDERSKKAEENADKQVGIMKTLTKAFKDSLQEQADAQLQMLQDNSKNLLRAYQSENLYAKRKDDLQAKMLKVADKNSVEYKALQEEMAASERARVQSTQQASELTSAMYDNMTLSITTSLGASLIAGKNMLKAMIVAAIDAAQAMIPVWSLKIAGEMLSSPNPANAMSLGTAGIAATGVLTGILTGLAQAAKAAVSGMQFYNGGFTGEGDPHQAAGIVHKKEWVFTESNTSKNRRHFEIIHSKNLSIAEYASKFLPGTVAGADEPDYLVASRIERVGEVLSNGFSAMTQNQKQLNRMFNKSQRRASVASIKHRVRQMY